MEAKRELIYFNGAGRAEVSRLALHAGGVDFTDTRIEFGDWPAVKADSNSVPGQLMGQMPCLSEGDFKICQSQAVAQYAADLAFPDRTPQQRAVDGMFVGIHSDLQTMMYKCLFGTEESKKAASDSFVSDITPSLQRVENLVPADGFVNGGDHPTLGDLALFDCCTSNFPGLTSLGVDLSNFPKLSKLVESVKNHKSLAGYLAKRGF
eukprot:CAMPEP_0174252204 /NCGR_PEP_ID=MMETSP0439-20130205/1778_1 /TAXON_ID=0 /ORGANISM="Stereomyxa ramosa, Strain Chinc5" /LENGTH=206 /DNA_ID=CAMNT_0015332713 /DNA_START=27 /DNA_END=647 /DNA_ORIENTATION=+